MGRSRKQTAIPKGSPPALEAFRNRARREFAFLQQEFGFREEPIPFDRHPYLNEFAVWFVSPTTRVVVEGINWGMNCRVALGGSGSLPAFENYDLGDLLALRRPDLADSPPKEQMEQLQHYAAALHESAQDVLGGDHSIFAELAATVQRRTAGLRYP